MSEALEWLQKHLKPVVACTTVALLPLILWWGASVEHAGDSVLLSSPFMFASLGAVLVALPLCFLPKVRRQRGSLPAWYLAKVVLQFASLPVLLLLLLLTGGALLFEWGAIQVLGNAILLLLIANGFLALWAAVLLLLRASLAEPTPPAPPPASR